MVVVMLMGAIIVPAGGYMFRQIGQEAARGGDEAKKELPNMVLGADHERQIEYSEGFVWTNESTLSVSPPTLLVPQNETVNIPFKTFLNVTVNPNVFKAETGATLNISAKYSYSSSMSSSIPLMINPGSNSYIPVDGPTTIYVEMQATATKDFHVNGKVITKTSEPTIKKTTIQVTASSSFVEYGVSVYPNYPTRGSIIELRAVMNENIRTINYVSRTFQGVTQNIYDGGRYKSGTTAVAFAIPTMDNEIMNYLNNAANTSASVVYTLSVTSTSGRARLVSIPVVIRR